MPENARLRRAWEELPKTEYGHRILTRHSDVRPDWIVQVLESQDSYEWAEYRTDRSGELVVRTIIAGWVPDSDIWIRVVFDGYLDSGAFHTAYRLNDRPVERTHRQRPRRG